MPTAIVRRNGHREAGKFRRIEVYADDLVVARLRPGESETIALPVGRHELWAKMDWFTSDPLELQLNGTMNAVIDVSLPSLAGMKGFLKPEGAIEITLVTGNST